ncbi:hypothetical protein, partial [Stenotrophomonas terrae]|uniref:hypothetical protein n=1 Tax=Stenotrophomonas terrae TaxID=405446 RepID=UPI001B80B745
MFETGIERLRIAPFKRAHVQGVIASQALYDLIGHTLMLGKNEPGRNPRLPGDQAGTPVAGLGRDPADDIADLAAGANTDTEQ